MLEEKETAPEPNEAPAGSNDYWTPARVRMLVIAIIAMAVMLVLGFGLVLYKVITQSLVAEPAVKNAPKIVSAAKPSFEIALDGHQIRHLAQSGSYLTLHVEKEGRAELWIINTTTEKLKKTIKLTP